MAAIESSNRYGPVTEHRVAAFERSVGHRLPDDYREYLLRHNGGVPSPCHFAWGGGDVSLIADMRGLHDGPSESRLDHAYQNYQGRIPSQLLPVGDDPGGNEICLGLGGEQRGRVHFWDHEAGTLHEIATSFSAFLDNLFDWTDPNEHVFVRICRIHDMADLHRYIASGVNLDATDEYGRALVDYAAMFGHADMIGCLHAAGASLHDARYYAERNKNEKLVAFLDSLGGNAA